MPSNEEIRALNKAALAYVHAADAYVQLQAKIAGLLDEYRLHFSKTK